MMRSKVNAKVEREEEINVDNKLQINKSEMSQGDKHVFRCQTDYLSKPFHLQWMRAKGVAAAASNGLQGDYEESNSLNPYTQGQQSE